MSAILDTVPCIDVTKDGTTYHLPIQVQESRDGNSRPIPVVRAPKLSFPQPLTIAGPEGGQFRRNYDIDEVIVADQTGGMGEDTYAAGQEVRTYQYSQCDTRFPGALVCRPLATQLGDTLANARTDPRIIELGYAGATLLATTTSNTPTYRYNAGTWTAIQSAATNIVAVKQVALGLNGVALTGTIGGGRIVFRSVDGITWDAMSGGAMTAPGQVAIFDNKLWVLDTVPTGAGSAACSVYTVYSSADFFSAAAGAGTWAAGNSITVPATIDLPIKLFVWADPTDRGRPTLWLLTNNRLWYYDYYAQTPNWKEWFTFRSPQEAGGFRYVDGVVSPRNGNLYVSIWGKEWIWEFTGATVERPSWNKRHGLPSTNRLSPWMLDANDSGLYVFCGYMPDVPSGTGAVLFMDDGQQFHPLYDNASNLVVGGGIGAGKIWVCGWPGANHLVLELDNPDTLSVPPLVTGRTFDSAANVHVSAWLAMGLKNVNKRLLHFEIDCIKANGTAGLDSGATVQVEYQGRSSTSWTSAGTLTSASTFPAVLAISGGWTFKEMRFRLTLTRGTATSATPIVRALKIGYRPRPKQRHTYTARVDLRDDAPAFATPDKRYRGYSASKLRQVLDELADNDDAGLDDALVGLAYGGDGNTNHPRRRSVPTCEVTIQSQEDPQHGHGLFNMIFNDISSPSSG